MRRAEVAKKKKVSVAIDFYDIREVQPGKGEIECIVLVGPKLYCRGAHWSSQDNDFWDSYREDAVGVGEVRYWKRCSEIAVKS